MYEVLMKRVQIKLHNMGFELARANDPYRLAKILLDASHDFDKLWKEAHDMVAELEGREPDTMM